MTREERAVAYYFTPSQIRKAEKIRTRRTNLLSQIRGMRDLIEEIKAKAAIRIAAEEKKITDLRKIIWAIQQNECDHPNQPHELGQPVTHCDYCGLGTEVNDHS